MEDADALIANCLAALRDYRIRASQEEIFNSLRGDWKEDVLFELQQAVEAYDFHRQQIAKCDQQLQRYLAALPTREVTPTTQTADPPPATAKAIKRQSLIKTRRPKGNEPAFALEPELRRILGVDLTTIDGINLLTVQTVVAEIGPVRGKPKDTGLLGSI